MSEVKVFVSYSWGIEASTGIVDEIASYCQTPRTINLIRDRDAMQHGDLIMDFMNHLSGGEHVLTVFSKPYFKSKWCMYELLKIWQKGDFKERTHPIIADDCDLQNDIYRINTAKYWIGKHRELEQVLEGEDPSLFIEEFKKLNMLRDIAQHVNELMNFAAGRLTTELPDLRAQHYTQILNLIQPLSGISNHNSDYNDAEFLDEVKKNLELDLKRLDIFRGHIERNCGADFTNQNGLIGYLIEQCLAGEFVQIIQHIESAFVDSFDEIGEDNYSAATKLYQSAKDMVSKLVLFNVKNEWMQAYRATNSQRTHHEHELPRMTFSSVEVVMSREANTFPEFRKNVHDLDWQSGRGIKLEPGIRAKDVVRDVVSRLHKQIRSQELGIQHDQTRAIEVLRKTIQQRKKHKNPKLRKNYFLILSDMDGALLADQSAQEELKRLLPDLAFINLQSERDTETFIVEDTDLMIAISEFFTTLEKYKPHE